MEEDHTPDWDATGAYLLAYAMPLEKILLTGKGGSKVPKLNAEQAKQVVLDGRGWTNKDRYTAYDQMNLEFLFESLGHWSPVVRERAAIAISRRKDDVPVDSLVKLLNSAEITTRLGACQALTLLKAKAEPAVPALRIALQDKDFWLHVKAAEALAAIGKPAMVALPELLEIITKGPTSEDPRGMEQRFIAAAIFGKMLKGSLDGVDRELLYKAVRAGLKNDDGQARGAISSIYNKLSTQEIQPLLPVIYQAVITPAPSGEMFADGVRIEGLRVMAAHRIEEGIQACVDYTRTQNLWASENRIVVLMDILSSYGIQAKAMIPQLQRYADEIVKGEGAYPKQLSLKKANVVLEAIRKIEASSENPTLIRIH